MEFVMNIILSSVRMATPLIFLALAELYSQRAGLVHIGLEGLASIGSLVGFLVSLITGRRWVAGEARSFFKIDRPSSSGSMISKSTRLGVSFSMASQNSLGLEKPVASKPVEFMV